MFLMCIVIVFVEVVVCVIVVIILGLFIGLSGIGWYEIISLLFLCIFCFSLVNSDI